MWMISRGPVVIRSWREELQEKKRALGRSSRSNFSLLALFELIPPNERFHARARWNIFFFFFLREKETNKRDETKKRKGEMVGWGRGDEEKGQKLRLTFLIFRLMNSHLHKCTSTKKAGSPYTQDRDDIS
jgi:hypothetical protein